MISLQQCPSSSGTARHFFPIVTFSIRGHSCRDFSERRFTAALARRRQFPDDRVRKFLAHETGSFYD
jgi:hypothetical protein